MNSKLLDKNQNEFITQNICKMIIIDTLPFSGVENKGFLTLILKIESCYIIPSRKSITTHIEKMNIDTSYTIKHCCINLYNEMIVELYCM